MDNMNGEQSYDMIDAGAYSVEELREATFEGRGRLSRPLALGLRGRKSYPQKVQDLERLLTNEQEMPRLRAMSAQFLGEIGGPDATRVLERGLDTRQGVTLSAVALALGKTGSREHVSRLESLTQRPDPVGREACARYSGQSPARSRNHSCHPRDPEAISGAKRTLNRYRCRRAIGEGSYGGTQWRSIPTPVPRERAIAAVPGPRSHIPVRRRLTAARR